MTIFTLLNVLYKINYLSPLGLIRLMAAIWKYGINIMILLRMAERTYGEKLALVDDVRAISYQQLWSETEKLSLIFKDIYNLEKGQKVAFMCKNHGSLVQSIFAVARLGPDLYLLNSDMGQNQFNQLVLDHEFDFIVYDIELSSLIEKSPYRKNRLLSTHDFLPAVNTLLKMKVNEHMKLPRASTSKIMLLTGGTTGKSKKVAHKPSLFNFLNPFLTLLTRLKLLQTNTAYIATPIYHGYGIAILFSFLALGKKVVISKGFEAEKACHLIHEHKVDVVTVVPLMIQKMLNHNVNDLRSLVCIASGGAKLNSKLVDKVFNELGDVLYNLYGTSEAGLNIIATPQDLRYSVATIGKKIKGVRLNVVGHEKQKVAVGTVGQFCIQNKWSMRNNVSSWIEAGDLGYQDENGYYFLCGRTDDLVVSAGVNVYPIEVEHVLIRHPQIEDVAVVGQDDEDFGQRLRAFVQLKENELLPEVALIEWLRPQVAKFQMPKEFVFVDQMPYTTLGKLDKKQLKGEVRKEWIKM